MIQLSYNFNFLHDAANQTILQNIVTIFENKIPDTLQVVYFRALKFFNFSTDGQSPPLNDISYKILNILISAETLMVFTTRGEKKKKLANTMIGLSGILPTEKSNYFNAIIEVYKDRSNLVHSGNQQLSKYIIDYETQILENKSFEYLQEMMLKIITHFPIWYFEIQGATNRDKYLDFWKQKISAFIPSEKYSLIQKIIMKIIYWLKNIGKIYSEG